MIHTQPAPLALLALLRRSSAPRMYANTTALHRCSLLVVLGVLCTACFDVRDPVPTDTDTEGSSTAGTDPSTDDADDTMDGSTSSVTTESSTTGPDGCPPAVFDASRFDEACFQ